MRFFFTRVVASLASLLFLTVAAVIAGCGGGSSSTPALAVSAPPATATPTPISSSTPVTTTAAIAAGGGTISATSASGTATVTIPPGALTAAASVSLTLFSDPATLASPFSGPPGATMLAGFRVDTSGVALALPLSVAWTPIAAPPAGAYRVAAFGAKGYSDVDTATLRAPAIVEDRNPSYVALTATGTVYVLYACPPQAAATPAPLALALTVPAAIPAFSSAAIRVGGSDANGNPLLPYAAPTASLDPAVGTASVSTNAPYPLTVSVGGPNDVAGTLTVTDPSHSPAPSATARIAIGSQRPSSGGDAFSYSGRRTQTIVRSNGAQATFAWTLAQDVSVDGNQTFAGTPNLTAFTTNETATTASPAVTTSTTSVTYYGFGDGRPVPYLRYGSRSSDSNGVSTTVSYGLNNRLVDRLPETASDGWTNTASKLASETDPDGSRTQLFIDDAGTYTISEQFVDGTNAAAQMYADGSGIYSAPFLGKGGNTLVTIGAIGSDGTIPIGVQWGSNPRAAGQPATTTTNVPAWYTRVPNFAGETVSITTNVALPAACAGAVSLPAQTIDDVRHVTSRIDTVLGEAQTTTLDEFTASGPGVVCAIAHDERRTYYDESGQSPGFVQFSGAPLQTTTTDQVLTLTSARVGATTHALAVTPIAMPSLETFERLLDQARLPRRSVR